MDIGGQTHQFTADYRGAGIRFSVGSELTKTARQTILEVPETGWVQAINGAGEDRDSAWVGELTDRIDLSAWPEGTRLIWRSERPHPGAQFTIFDEHGYRYMCFITDQDRNDIAVLELRHATAPVSRTDPRRQGHRQRNLPHYAFEHNQTWLETSLIAQDLLAWTKLICLDGELATAEAKRAAPAGLSHRRQARPSRATHPPQARSRLALVTSVRRGVPAPADDPGALLSTHRTRGRPSQPIPRRPTLFACPKPYRRRHKHHTDQRPSRARPHADSDAHPPLTPPRPNRCHHRDHNGASRLTVCG